MSRLTMVMKMGHEIIDCLDFGIDKPFLLDVLTEKLLSFVKIENGFQKIKDEGESCKSRIVEISALPVQDTCWSITEVPLKHHDLSSLRMLVLSDSGVSESFTVKFSVEEAAQQSYEDQALQLLYQGCLYPVDGRKSRRPRFLCSDGLQEASNSMQKKIDDLSIHFCGELSTKVEVETLRKHMDDATQFRHCSACGIAGTSAFFNECCGCGAVLYCGEKCKSDDWLDSHKEWCSLFKEFMAKESELAELPFNFASVTTGKDFHEKRRKELLEQSDIYCHSSRYGLLYSLSNTDTDTEDPHHDLSRPSIVEKDLSLRQVYPPSLDKPLEGWQDYYSFRRISRDSLVAELLHFSLTLYYIITQLIPKDFKETSARIHQMGHVCIHVIGAEREVEMFYPFLECARLLSPLHLDLHLYGNNFGKDYKDQDLKKENLCFKTHQGLYHQMNKEDIPSPTLAVCFNGGIGAYTSFTKTIKALMRKSTPLYYTDYGQACIMFSSKSITNSKAGHVSKPIVNPFRSPLRMMAPDQNLPRYSNAFITYIKPFSRTSEVPACKE